MKGYRAILEYLKKEKIILEEAKKIEQKKGIVLKKKIKEKKEDIKYVKPTDNSMF